MYRGSSVESRETSSHERECAFYVASSPPQDNDHLEEQFGAARWTRSNVFLFFFTPLIAIQGEAYTTRDGKASEVIASSLS